MEHNDIVKEILINEFFVLVISSPKLYRISGMTQLHDVPVLTSTHPGPGLFPSTGQPLSAVEVRYLLYSSQLPLPAVQGRKPKQRHFSGITRQDSIRKFIAQFLEVIIRLSRQNSRWRKYCDMLRNARAMLAYCSRNDVMTFMLCGASF